MNNNFWIRLKVVGMMAIGFLVFLTPVMAEESPTAEFPSLVAHYHSRVVSLKDLEETYRRAWYFFRAPKQVEVLSEDNLPGELWKREADGQIYYVKLFPRQNRAIDYFPGDLTALGQKVDWKKINTMIDPGLLNRTLHFVTKSEVNGHPTQRYSGEDGGVKIEVEWIEDKQLPARITRHFSDRTVTIELQSLWSLAQAPVSPSSLKGYQHIDYADIGDLEADPFFQKLAHQGTREHTH